MHRPRSNRWLLFTALLSTAAAACAGGCQAEQRALEGPPPVSAEVAAGLRSRADEALARADADAALRAAAETARREADAARDAAVNARDQALAANTALKRAADAAETARAEAVAAEARSRAAAEQDRQALAVERARAGEALARGDAEAGRAREVAAQRDAADQAVARAQEATRAEEQLRIQAEVRAEETNRRATEAEKVAAEVAERAAKAEAEVKAATEKIEVAARLGEAAVARAEAATREVIERLTRERRRHVADIAVTRALREESTGRSMTALAHAISAIRADPSAGAAGLAWVLRQRAGRLLWTSPAPTYGTADVPGHSSQVRAVAFRSDGTRVASAGDDKTIRIWEVTTGRELLRINADKAPVRHLVFSHDGTMLAAVWNGDDVPIWDPVTGAEKARLTGHKGGVTCVAFSPDGVRLATSARDGGLRLWETKTLAEAAVVDAPALVSFAFSNDSTRGAGGSERSSTLFLWNFVPGKTPTRTDVKDTQTSLALTSRPDGRVFAAVTNAGDVRLLASGDGHEIARARPASAPCYAATFDRTSSRLVVAGRGSAIHVCDPNTCAEIGRLEGHRDAIHGLAPGGDPRTLASGSNDHTVRLWSLGAPDPITLDAGPIDLFSNTVISSDGTVVAGGTTRGDVCVWNGATGKEVFRLKGHESPVTRVVFSPDGARIASASSDKTVRIWAAGTQVALLAGHEARVVALAYSPDGARLASGSEDGKVLVWDLATGAEIGRVESPKRSSVRWLLFSPDGGRLAVAGSAGDLALWNVAENKPQGDPTNVRVQAFSGAFSRDGTFLAVAAQVRIVTVLEAASGKVIAQLTAPDLQIRRVGISPDGSRVAALSSWRPSKGWVWDVSTGAQIDDLSGGAGVALAYAWGSSAWATGDFSEGHGKPPSFSEGELEWRAAWSDRDAGAEPNTLPPRVAAILQRWDRDLGMRADAVGGTITPLATPGTAYQDDPKIAEMCK